MKDLNSVILWKIFSPLIVLFHVKRAGNVSTMDQLVKQMPQLPMVRKANHTVGHLICKLPKYDLSYGFQPLYVMHFLQMIRECPHPHNSSSIFLQELLCVCPWGVLPLAIHFKVNPWHKYQNVQFYRWKDHVPENSKQHPQITAST